MAFTILLALSGLTLSAVAIYYSVIGLTAVFAASFWAVAIMGTTLEVSKLVAASWLKAYWHRIPGSMKVYMSTAVIVLMIITSMGIFGFLSKAHLDQNIISGDVQSRIAIYDEKIKTEKENIEANRRALKQMDEAVDQVLGRSTSETGADKAVAVRRSQQKERSRLQTEISQSQKSISELNTARAPIAAEVRKVEAEVGPIKYIAKLIYGEDTDVNMLEKAVTWVIMIIVFVFDPLAVLMLLGAQMTWRWHQEEKQKVYENIDDQLPEVEKVDDLPIEPKEDSQVAQVWPTASLIWPFAPQQTQPLVEETTVEKLPAETVEPVAVPESKNEETWVQPVTNDAEDFDIDEYAKSYDPADADAVKDRMRRWKEENPESTIKDQRLKLDLGMIDHLPWETDPNLENVEHRTYMVKDAGQQVTKTRDENYIQNAEQSEETLWQRIQNKKAK